MKILVFADLHYFGGTVKTFNTERKLVQFALPMLKALIKVAEEEKVERSGYDDLAEAILDGDATYDVYGDLY